jgi:hypothetical protein
MLFPRLAELLAYQRHEWMHVPWLNKSFLLHFDKGAHQQSK